MSLWEDAGDVRSCEGWVAHVSVIGRVFALVYLVLFL
jgi:hypothetical protein